MAQRAKGSKRTPSRNSRKTAAKVVTQKSKNTLLDKSNRFFPLAVVLIFGFLTALVLLYTEWQKNRFESNLTDLVAESADFGETAALVCSQKEITRIDFENGNWEVDLGTLHKVENVEYSVVDYKGSKQLLVSVTPGQVGYFQTLLNMATKPGKYTLSYNVDYDKAVLIKDNKVKRIGIAVHNNLNATDDWANYGTGLDFSKKYGVITQFNVEERVNGSFKSGSYNMNYLQGHYPKKVTVEPPFVVHVVRRDDPNRNRGSINKDGIPYYVGRRKITNNELKKGNGKVFFYIVGDARNSTEKFHFYIDNIELITCK
jgi:hypothetical protein